jgi:hypothetical protein
MLTELAGILVALALQAPPAPIAIDFDDAPVTHPCSDFVMKTAMRAGRWRTFSSRLSGSARS